MSEKKPLILNPDGYVLLLRGELTRLLAIESRARHKLTQLRAMTTDAGGERRLAHVEALEFVLGDAAEITGGSSMSNVTTSEPSVETRRRIAERIAYKYLDSTESGRRLQVDIEAALKERDERAVRIIERRIAALASVTHPTNHNRWEQLDLAELIGAIRKEGVTE